MRTRLAAALAALLLTSAAPAPRPAAWPAFRDGVVEQWFRIDPANAVYQGRHDFDGQLADWSEAGLKRRGDFLRDTIARATAMTGLTAQDAFERDYLVMVAQAQLFWLADADQPHRNPAWYVGAGLDPNVYVARNYADKPTRMRAPLWGSGQQAMSPAA